MGAVESDVSKRDPMWQNRAPRGAIEVIVVNLFSVIFVEPEVPCPRQLLRWCRVLHASLKLRRAFPRAGDRDDHAFGVRGPDPLPHHLRQRGARCRGDIHARVRRPGVRRAGGLPGTMPAHKSFEVPEILEVRLLHPTPPEILEARMLHPTPPTLVFVCVCCFQVLWRTG